MTTDSPTSGATPPEAAATRDLAALNAYVTQYYGKYTDEALIDHLMRVGHQRSDIEAAIRAAAATDVIGPINVRARRIVRVLYLVTYGLLAAGMLTNFQSGSFGIGIIGSIVLAVVLGVAFLIAVGWLHWRGSRDRSSAPGLISMLSIPLVLLVLVAGSCLWTGLPTLRPVLI